MKKSFKKAGLVFLIILIGGISGILAEIFVVPWLSGTSMFSKYESLHRGTTVIKETEQVVVKETFSVEKTAEKVVSSVVSIATFDKKTEEASEVVRRSKISNSEVSIKSGVIITSDGLIMSVLDERLRSALEKETEDTLAFRMLANDGKEQELELVGIDKFSEIVFYRTDATNLAVPPFGNSNELISGEKIIVCGNSGGKDQNNFSFGVIRQKDNFFTLLNSNLSSSEKMEGAIIADVTIDEENVGGPAVDFNGTMIGLVNQIEKNGRVVKFVVPINNIQNAIDKVISGEGLARPSLGVYYLSVNQKVALENNLEVGDGAIVHSSLGQGGLAVIKGSAADEAGIKIGDIIVQVGDEKITNEYALSDLISKRSVGEEVEILVIRDEEERKITVKLQ